MLIKHNSDPAVLMNIEIHSLQYVINLFFLNFFFNQPPGKTCKNSSADNDRIQFIQKQMQNSLEINRQTIIFGWNKTDIQWRGGGLPMFPSQFFFSSLPNKVCRFLTAKIGNLELWN